MSNNKKHYKNHRYAHQDHDHDHKEHHKHMAEDSKPRF
jgi:hypothetical protein